MTIGEKIKEFRLAAGLTQAEFAKNLNISRYFLSLIENGEKELSDSTAGLLLNHITGREVPGGFKRSYFEGQNFSKIIGALREKGITLSQLRDKDFKTKGSQLSLMYLGLVPVPDKIKKILEEKYNVNLEFISLGKKVPIFSDTSVEDSEIEFPYFNNQSFNEALKRYEELDFESSLKISIPKINVDLFVDISGDNLVPRFNGRELLGIRQLTIKNINYGELYLIRYINGECQLRRIFQSSDAKKLILKKEDENFPEVVIEKKTIKSLFVVKTVIIKDFY